MPTAFSLRCPGWSLRVILTLAIALTPFAATQAQTPATKPANETLDTRWLTPESVAVGYLRPQQVLTAEGAELLPHEIFAAAGKKYFGIDPVDVKLITVAVEATDGPEPNVAIIVESTKPFEKSGLSPEITGHTEPAEINGTTYLKSRDPMAGPSFYQLNESTLIIASEPMLQKLVAQGEEPQSSPLISAIKSHPASDDLYVAVDVKSLRPLIHAALAQDAQGAPPELLQFLEAPELIRAAEFSFNLSTNTPPVLNVYANNADDATKLVLMIDEGIEIVRMQTAENLAMNQAEDPIQQAFMEYSARRTEQTLDQFRPVVDGHKLTFFPPDPDDPDQSFVEIQQIAVIGILVALLLPAVQAAREAARRNDSLARLRDFSIGLQNYHDTQGKFPAHASYSDDGKPLLSWRVHLLPYIEEAALYRQFHLDEPWDSEHNQKLIAQMPDIYQSAKSPLQQTDGKTLYMAPIGENYVMDGTENSVGLRQLTDGTSKTIVLVEADPGKAVIWTKPDDLKVDPDNPVAGLGSLYAGGIFQAAFADGHARGISKDINPETLKALFTRNGREVIGAEDF